MAARVKRAKTEHTDLLFAEGSAGPFVQLSRSIIEVWNCLDQRAWAQFSVVSKWTNWSAKLPGHGVHAWWIEDRPPGPSVVAQNALRTAYCEYVCYVEPTGLGYKSGCRAVAQVLGRCSALQKLTIRLADPELDTEQREVGKGNLAPLSLLVQLRELRVTGGEPLSGLDSLTTMSCLEVLELKPVDLTKLPALASVRDLQVKPLKKITEETAQRLAWPNLTALSLGGAWLSAEAMERLTRNGKLKRLETFSFEMVAPAPALVHVTVQGWSSVQPPSAPLFHKDLSHLAVYQAWGVKGTWCLHAPFMTAPCPASLQTLALGCPWPRDNTPTWAFARWVTGASQTSLRAMDLDTCDYVRFPDFGPWLQGLKKLRRLQVGSLPADIRLPQLHELSIRSHVHIPTVDQIRNLPLCVPELRILRLYHSDMNFDGHLLALMPQLRCLVLYSNDNSKSTVWKVLDEMLGCTCDCPETLVHLPKLRSISISIVCVPTSDDKPKWLLKAKARNIVVAENFDHWSLDHSFYTE